MVTGASSGIGAAVARALARQGTRVALAARRHDALHEVQAGLEGGARSLVYPRRRHQPCSGWISDLAH